MDVNLQVNVRHPVIIIGAGPVGLMAGIILTEAGVPIEIYERRFEGMNELRASVIHPRILEMLDFYGLIDRFIKAGNPFTKLSTYIKGKFISFLDIERVRSKYSFMLGCGQVITEALLQEKLIELGIKVKRGWQYISHTVMEDAAYVNVRLKRVDSEEMVERHASYVIGCDGGHSSVRKTIGVEFNAQSLGSKVCVCDVELDAEWLPASCFIVDNDGYGGVIRARKERQYRLFMDCYTDRPNCTEEEVIATFKRRYYPYNVERMCILSISYFSPNECRASKYISDDKRVFLCGDAAHVHSPMGAQGMNTGLQDAENLAWKVGMVYNGLAKPELLKSYATERIPIADAVINHSRGLSSIAKRPWKFLLLTRVLRFMQYLPNVWSRPLLEKNAQLRVKYASSEHYGIFPDTPAWKRASSSWFPFWYFSDPLCSPGTRAINCQVIDANTITYTHINRFFANNKKSYTALVFIDCRIVTIDTAVATSTNPIEELKSLTESLGMYKSPIPMAFILHGVNVKRKMDDLPDSLRVIVSHLNGQFHNTPVYIDIEQGDCFDNNTMASVYNCTLLNQHAVYLVRPDTYISARMLLSEAPTAVRVCLNTIGLI